MSSYLRTLVKVALAVVCAAVIFAAARVYLVSRPAGYESPLVTAAEFAQIIPGMTYAECVAIIGAEGTPYGAVQPPGVPIDDAEWVSFTWTNTHDSAAEINFHYGRVDKKRAYGLPD